MGAMWSDCSEVSSHYFSSISIIFRFHFQTKRRFSDVVIMDYHILSCIICISCYFFCMLGSEAATFGKEIDSEQ